MDGRTINPFEASGQIRESYLRYLITTFGIKDAALAEQFRVKAREAKGLFQGPMLEATPKYATGETLHDLVTSGQSCLTREFLDYLRDGKGTQIPASLGLHRALYLHQKEALRRVIEHKHNIVVATGTGSGKTECFLLPIIDHLMRERAAGTIGPGVRALIIYPMNALANDQVFRLRSLLPPETGVTFGRYTGQTKHGYQEGLDTFRAENNNDMPQANELFCREQILGIDPPARFSYFKKNLTFLGPPHILLTNFAMLEYLLMRPLDSPLFDEPNSSTWKFLVLDEAHVYSGALGTEIGYLLRRLKDRVCHSRQGVLRCIATSATMGAASDQSRKTLATSFSDLFGERFYEDDVITGQVVSSDTIFKNKDTWGSGSGEFYSELLKVVNWPAGSKDDFIRQAQKLANDKQGTGAPAGWPDAHTFKKAITLASDAGTVQTAISAFLYELLTGDCQLRNLLKRLEKGPLNISAGLIQLSEGSGTGPSGLRLIEQGLPLLVDLASRAAKDEQSPPLLAARYHFFVKSLEGLSICFAHEDNGADGPPMLLIGRQQNILDAPGGPAVGFEIRACARCGQHYLHGHILDDGRFISYPKRTRLDEGIKHEVFFAINLKEITDSSEDEEALQEEKPTATDELEDANDLGQRAPTSSSSLEKPRYLCSRCGFLADDATAQCPYCREHNSLITRDWVEVRRVYSERGGTIKTCPACGAQKHFGGSILRAFSPGDDAAGAVLGQALMGNIPPSAETPQPHSLRIGEEIGRFGQAREITVPGPALVGKRRLLAFSDSRQDAAFFATYINRTAGQILHRQLIYSALEKLSAENPGTKAFGCNELINPLLVQAQKAGLFGPGSSELTKKSDVAKWLTAELSGIQRRFSLEGVGLLAWELRYRDQLQTYLSSYEEELEKDYGLKAARFLDLLEIFLGELRKQNVLQPIGDTNTRDLYFWPRNRPYSIRKDTVNSALSIASWMPQSGANSRSDFIRRFFAAIGIRQDVENKTKRLLEDLWQFSQVHQAHLPLWEEVLSVNALWGGRGNDGVVWRLRWDAWQCSPSVTDEHRALFRCNTCGNIYSRNPLNVCPTYRCVGTLMPVQVQSDLADNHYRNLYQAKAIPIEAQEHTAQLTAQAGAKRQQEFMNDRDPLNILSCSTTFELGVDVGQLHAVFIRNVPPTVANYVQRSGRAGRRLGAVAFVLTFCRNRPHDMSYFEDTEKLISGKITPAVLKIDNTRIARRHLHSIVISRFWRFHHPELFNGPEGKSRGIVRWLFFDIPGTFAKLTYEWLKSKPVELIQEIERIMPPEVAQGLGVRSWQWTTSLVDEGDKSKGEIRWEGKLGLAQGELISEFDEYRRIQSEQPKLYNFAEEQKRRILETQTLDYLASRNVLPKYGFPVDVVSLRVHSRDAWAREIELDRDLSLALGEYAPGCTLVANGRVIKSYALEKVAGKGWPQYKFAICLNCGKLHRAETSQSEIASPCECGQALDKSEGTLLEGTFVEPVFGFRTFIQDDGETPVDLRPQRTFPSRIYFSHYRSSVPEPFMREGTPNRMSGILLEKRYSRDGILVVINPGLSERGFWLCSKCGFGDAVASGKPKAHKAPWGNKCDGRLWKSFLGHEFPSDVLELRFSGPAIGDTDQGFWLSMTAGLLAGAAKALDIERDDIDGTVLQFGGLDHRSIVLFDNVPGGAGHVQRISNELKRVMQATFNILDNCPGCSRDQSCNACLRTFRNQYAHDLLKRGPVADMLGKVMGALYSPDGLGYFPLGITDKERWIEQLIRRARRADLIFQEMPGFPLGEDGGREWYSILHGLAGRATKVRFIFTGDMKRVPDEGPNGKVALHSLAAIARSPNLGVVTDQDAGKMRINAYIETETETYAIKWPKGQNPFHPDTKIELTILEEYVKRVKDGLDKLDSSKTYKEWTSEEIARLLQRSLVLPIEKNSRQSWENLLGAYIPDGLLSVEIYDRYLRNVYQFISLDMFLDMLARRASHPATQVKITTTAAEDLNKIRANFEKRKARYQSRKLNIEYEILEPSTTLPHFRRINLAAPHKKMTIWLEKGLDIYRFEELDPPSFSTIDSYLVIEDA